MTNFTINGDVAKKIEITLPDGKKVTIEPSSECNGFILFPQGGRGGEFTHGMPIIGHRGKDNICLVPPEGDQVRYAPGGEGDYQLFIRISGERARG